MSKPFVSVMLAVSAAAATAQEPVVSDNWAAAPINDERLIKRLVRESIEEEKDIAIAQSKAAAIPQRYTASSQPAKAKYERFAERFDDAKVPGCLTGDGLKRQSTFIFSGLLALPFIPIAYLRGKCN
jgi:hypothetical protein